MVISRSHRSHLMYEFIPRWVLIMCWYYSPMDFYRENPKTNFSSYQTVIMQANWSFHRTDIYEAVTTVLIGNHTRIPDGLQIRIGETVKQKPSQGSSSGMDGLQQLSPRPGIRPAFDWNASIEASTVLLIIFRSHISLVGPWKCLNCGILGCGEGRLKLNIICQLEVWKRSSGPIAL